MTNEEASKLLDGVPAANPDQANSEPANDETKGAPTVATAANGEGTTSDAVSGNDGNAAETEAAAKSESRGKKSGKKFYSPERAMHEFARQNRKLKSVQAERDALLAELEKYKGLKRENFVDEKSGKVNDDDYNEYRLDMELKRRRAEELNRKEREIVDEQDEEYFYQRTERELGDKGKEFRELCSQVVGEAGETRLQLFESWLAKLDGQGVVAARVNASKRGIALLQKLMTDKEARMSVVSQRTPYGMEKALDAVEQSLEIESKKERLSELVKSLRDKRPKKLKPTGSAFSGASNTGKVAKNNDYFASLL